tara:strand:- start:43 stop:564 length:522 start_codon:yes stop_codon:yes gene_type:complete
MTSQLRVDKILPVDGAPTGGGGGVIQVKTVTKTDKFITASQTPVDITGFSVAITPKFSTSKILVMYSLNVSGNSGYGSFRLARDNDNTILIGDASGNQERSTYGTYVSSSNIQNVSGTVLDSPSTTSAVTYKMQAYNPYSSSYLTAINYQQGDANLSYINVVPSVLTVMEVSS